MSLLICERVRKPKPRRMGGRSAAPHVPVASAQRVNSSQMHFGSCMLCALPATLRAAAFWSMTWGNWTRLVLINVLAFGDLPVASARSLRVEMADGDLLGGWAARPGSWRV